ncbi:MAG TPA: hypothetical protein VM434_17550 [Beijerinckiaceae bacterium]|nr:hypothetical protein [Beijerinckiaceae bacterium]
MKRLYARIGPHGGLVVGVYGEPTSDATWPLNGDYARRVAEAINGVGGDPDFREVDPEVEQGKRPPEPAVRLTLDLDRAESHTHAIADLLCWMRGFMVACRLADVESGIIGESVDRVSRFNGDLKDAISAATAGCVAPALASRPAPAARKAYREGAGDE